MRSRRERPLAPCGHPGLVRRRPALFAFHNARGHHHRAGPKCTPPVLFVFSTWYCFLLTATAARCHYKVGGGSGVYLNPYEGEQTLDRRGRIMLSDENESRKKQSQK